MEAAPENWIGVGGRFGKQLRLVAERYPIVLHGLSLDIGGPDPIDTELVGAVRDLMREIDVPLYSEHLTYCAAQGHLYDLLPLPFTEEAVHHVAARVRQVQDIMGRSIALENASYYAQPHTELSEAQFINAVLQESGCDLLLDVNNIYVNAINHCYDPVAFLDALPLERVRYIHVAGHYDEAAGPEGGYSRGGRNRPGMVIAHAGLPTDRASTHTFGKRFQFPAIARVAAGGGAYSSVATRMRTRPARGRRLSRGRLPTQGQPAGDGALSAQSRATAATGGRGAAPSEDLCRSCLQQH